MKQIVLGHPKNQIDLNNLPTELIVGAIYCDKKYVLAGYGENVAFIRDGARYTNKPTVKKLIEFCLADGVEVFLFDSPQELAKWILS